MRRISSEDDQDLRDAKQATTDLYYSTTSPGGSTAGGVGTAITLPSGGTWTQADLEHAAAMSGRSCKSRLFVYCMIVESQITLKLIIAFEQPNEIGV